METPIKALLRHMWVIGASGAGKSTAMLSWLTQLIDQGYGVGLLDPNADLYRDFRLKVAISLRRRGYDRVIFIDPADEDFAVGFNPLELVPGEVAERKAAFLATIISKLFHTDFAGSPRMQSILRHTFWLLMRFNLTLVEYPLLLTLPDLRASLANRLPETDYMLKNFWLQEFPSNERLVQDWTQSSLNKVRAFVSDPAMRRIFGQTHSTINFSDIMNERMLMLVNLSKSQLGEDSSRLFGGFVAAQVQHTAWKRENLPKDQRTPWFLVIDEFQNVITDDIEQLLAESRKYGLSVIIANQFLGQLLDYPKLQQAILNTVQNWAVFRIGATDAELLAKDMFSPPIDEAKDVRERKNPTGFDLWPYTTVYDTVWRPLPEIKEREARKLKDQPDFQFWYRRRGYDEAQRMRIRMPYSKSSRRDAEAVAELIEVARQRWTRPASIIDREIDERRNELLNHGFDHPAGVGDRGY